MLVKYVVVTNLTLIHV